MAINFQFKKQIEKVLKSYRLNWQVRIRAGQVADFRVGKKGKISIKKGLCFSLARLEGTVVHEIETHVLRAENSKIQPILFSIKAFLIT